MQAGTGKDAVFSEFGEFGIFEGRRDQGFDPKVPARGDSIAHTGAVFEFQFGAPLVAGNVVLPFELDDQIVDPDDGPPVEVLLMENLAIEEIDILTFAALATVALVSRLDVERDPIGILVGTEQAVFESNLGSIELELIPIGEPRHIFDFVTDRVEVEGSLKIIRKSVLKFGL